MTSNLRIVRDAPLRQRNTFGVAARAPWLVSIDDPAALPQALQSAPLRDGLALVLGGGSNLLFAGDPDGAVLELSGRSVQVLRHEDEHAIVRADAGVQWHGFVLQSLALGYAGLENLALIPGTVGASPIQNIGAYGVEVRDFVQAVEAFEPASGQWHRFDNAACGFGYRDSRFKQSPDRYLISSVEFALPLRPALKLDYAGLGEELAAMGVDAPTPQNVADAVIAIRRRKLPDPAVLGNAGSFFKNPILPAAQAEALLARHPAMPVFRGADAGTRKLSAAWLIDACGWKGHRDGDAGVSPAHALVLVNHGGASGQQLLDLARRIAESVQARFQVAIEPEPRIVGARW
ncbi:MULTISPECIES: UDP-N-acetylmuramate dehydrogenase [Lysobacter]|uniref:UDP-N-acetylenolpyruvoylglucosamine reductase n=1 Tax=Lysobacter gummosus TaxID=262324 RepID=A0ABY3XHW1_9GAMM|nr:MULTISPECIES: UDP-N-acetylmuramate dehydrogenase [Lysobacter]ALN90768.1 UDP-N-acetylenolpyruvoylglucosamine reductase [Lysobacter gummosus]UJB17482.1 UDP-N-acetylmuramate dehydrogenase [Lysobacter capsici]UJQ28795.1 UDP-N-acetylmuramate dehydrogenase [Lysobacter gummosus]UNP31237.1 UDP-N-acetylmuramate dehydrogenase [Lysobacter gummosus]